MKKALQFLCLLLVVFCCSVQTSLAQTPATPGMGADLSYAWLGNDSLEVTYKFFRNCKATPAPLSVTLNYQAAGCHTGGNITLNSISQTPGQPYCGIYNNCAVSNKLNYIESVFTGILVIPAQCNNWVLSVTNDARMGGNLVTAATNLLYTDMALNNAGGLINSSPVFADKPLFYICDNIGTTFGINYTDPDGDSIGFSLAPPLSGPNTPLAFQSLYTYSTPLGQTSQFSLWQNGGAVSTSGPFSGDSTYAIRIKVTEYRNINGTLTAFTHSNRDILFVIKDCSRIGFRCQPTLVSPLQHINTTFEIPADTTTCLNFTNVHNCDSNYYNLRYDTLYHPLGAVIYYNGNDISLCWSPTTAQVRGTPYQLGVNTSLIPLCSSPVYGFQPLMVRVYAPVGTGSTEISGKTAKLAAYPNPYSSEITFRINLKEPVSQKELIILNQLGQEIDRIKLENLQPGDNTVSWPNGSKVASGVYLAFFMDDSGVVTTARFVKIP